MENILNDIEKRLFNLSKIFILVSLNKVDEWVFIGKLTKKLNVTKIIIQINNLKYIKNIDTLEFISSIEKKYIKYYKSQVEHLETIIENEGINYSNEFINNSTDRQRIILSIVFQYKELAQFIFDAKKEQTKLHEHDKQNKIPEKYYAFYHWILIEIGKAKAWNRNENNKYPKEAIMNYAKREYSLTDGQGFYREFTGMDITNKVAIVRSINDSDYKSKLIKISGNNADIRTLLKDYPTL